MVLVLWMAVAASLAVAAAAWVSARRAARRLDELAERYWEMKYQYSELRTRLDEAPRAGAAPAPADGRVITVGPVDDGVAYELRLRSVSLWLWIVSLWL